MAFCSTCGARLGEGATCTACGASTAPPVMQSGPAQAPTASGTMPQVPPPGASGVQPQSAGYPMQTPGYPPQSGGYSPQSGGYPPQSGGYPPQSAGYPQQTAGYPPQSGGYPPQTPGYPPQTPGYPPQTPGYPPQTPGYPPPGAVSIATGSPPQAASNNRLIGAVIIVLMAVYYYYTHTSSPASVVERCLDGIQEWNAPKVLECLRPGDRAQFSKLPVLFAELQGKGVTVRIDQRKIEVGNATQGTCTVRAVYLVSMSAPGEQPQTGPVQDAIELVQEGGTWYIVGSQMLAQVIARLQQQSP